MRLLVFYALQILMVVAGFTAVSVVFVTINTAAMADVANKLVAEAAIIAVNEVVNPLEKFSVQLKGLANAMTSAPHMQAPDPSQTDDPQRAFDASYTPPAHPQADTITRLEIGILLNNPLAAFVYESYELPDNASQWTDRGVGRTATTVGPADISIYHTSFKRADNWNRDPTLISCTVNVSFSSIGHMAPALYDPGYTCVVGDFASVGNPYQDAAKAMRIDDAATGRWTSYSGWYDPFTGTFDRLITFAVPLRFSSAPDPVLGYIYTTNAIQMDLSAQFLSDALAAAKGSDATIDLAMFWDTDDTLVAWTLPIPPADPTDSLKILSAGTTGSKFDDAQRLFASSGWCNASLSGGPPRLSECRPAAEASAVVSDDTNLFTLRRVTHINAKFSIVISGARKTFFGPGERARAVGIAVSVVTCVVAVLACLGLWYAIARPLSRLIEQMQGAARLEDAKPQDEEAAGYGRSVVTEIAEADDAFQAMNTQLLAAKPFMPRHLLIALQHTEDPNAEDLDLLDESHAHPADSRSTREDRSVTRGSATTKHSRRSASRVSDPSHVIGPATSLPLAKFNVAVLVCNVSSFAQLCKTCTSDELHARYAELLEVIATSAAAQRGVIDSVQGDHVVVTFNSATRCANPSARAVHAAFDIHDGVQKRSILPSAWQQVTFGVASSRAQCGAMGTASLKCHATLGDAMRGAVGLQRMARALHETGPDGIAVTPHWCMVTAQVAAECTTFAHYKHVTVVSMPPSQRLQVATSVFPVCAAVTQGATPHTDGVESLPHDVHDGEWLYEVGSTMASNPWTRHNTTFERDAGLGRNGRLRDGPDAIEGAAVVPNGTINGLVAAVAYPVAVDVHLGPAA